MLSPLRAWLFDDVTVDVDVDADDSDNCCR